MKKIFLLIAACFSLTAPLAAQHCQGPYVSGFGGANFKNDIKEHGAKLDFNTGYTASGAVGYKFAPFRAEVEGAYRHNTSKKQQGAHASVNTSSAMVNGYYDFDQFNLPLNMTPYVGAGVGAARTEVKGHARDVSVKVYKKTKFAYQGIVGVAVPINERLDFTTEYRYFNSGHKKDHNHTVGAGLRLWF